MWYVHWRFKHNKKTYLLSYILLQISWGPRIYAFECNLNKNITICAASFVEKITAIEHLILLLSQETMTQWNLRGEGCVCLCLISVFLFLFALVLHRLLIWPNLSIVCQNAVLNPWSYSVHWFVLNLSFICMCSQCLFNQLKYYICASICRSK